MIPDDDITKPGIVHPDTESKEETIQRLMTENKALADRIQGALWTERTPSGSSKVVKWGSRFWTDFFIAAWEAASRARKTKLITGAIGFQGMLIAIWHLAYKAWLARGH